MGGAEEGEGEAGPWQPVNKKHKQAPLSQLTREELEARVRQLEAHNTQLRNLLSKSQAGGGSETPSRPQKQRQFDFSKHSRRHVALKLCYLGWDYQGFAVQEDSQNTIEAQLFAALLKTRLIESRETSNYHRCGRTDKGVSAFDQVISITLRSKLRKGVGVLGPPQGPQASVLEGVEEQKKEEVVVVKEEEEEEEGEEINYVQLLNRVLPQEIRILAWCPVPEGFSARFDCCRRTYKYFFPRGGLDLQAMQEAGQHLVGEHDFRNLCKMDVGNGVVNFRRRILSVMVEGVAGQAGGGGDGGGGESRLAKVDGEDKSSRSIDDRGVSRRERNRENGSRSSREENRSSYKEEEERANIHGDVKNGEGVKSGRNIDDRPVDGEESSRGICNSSKEEEESANVCDDVSDNGENGEGVNSDPNTGDGDVASGESHCKNSSSCKEKEEEEGSANICDGGDGYEMCVVTIEGQAFLWHQVRAVMAVLFLVGEGKERPDIVATLLDVEKHPRKPQYSLASDLPLSLWSVEFEGLVWRWEAEEVRRVVAQMQGAWAGQAVRATMIRSMLKDLETRYRDLAKPRLENEKLEKTEKEVETQDPVLVKSQEGHGRKKESKRRRKDDGDEEVCEGREVREQVTSLMTGTRTKVYRPLLSRPTCESLEQRVEHYVKRQRLDPGVLQKNLT